ncbi:hypothetical protein [Spiroplasma endosymbiont of Amphimallon solstitiale]|uniref:hypothetical protein n=1 Tax=Spiroplasma endosymbiont of Amphimallon solstitiale TaxID=3066288 RepID=UPI00313AFC74
MTYSETNPTDPYFIVPEVFNCLRKIKEYPNITGFNLDVLPKRNDFFSNFYSNCGEDSPLTRYLEILNLKTNDKRVKIYPKYPKNIIGTELWFDTTGIKSFDNLTTLELFTKYFSNDSLQLVDGKEGQEEKVISAIGGGELLWEVDKDNPNFIHSKDDKGISANDKRIIDVGIPTFETDGTNKEYVDNLIDKKQNINDEDLQTVAKQIVLAINENKANIDKKQDKEIWKVISKSKNNREWDTFEINFNTVYRVIITLDRLPVNQANIKHKVEFKTGNYLGGDYLLAKFKIKDEDVILTLTVRESSFNCSLYLKGGDINYGAILSLEELQNTIKVDVTPKLKINSKSLETNEVEENCWDIELPDNPTPSPSGSNWKEVGIREKNKWDNWQITYDFIVNKHYRVYYSWSIYNPVYTIQEFIITDNKIAGVPIQTFNDSVNIVILSVQHAKWITIYTGKGNLKGNVWKLEELQE